MTNPARLQSIKAHYDLIFIDNEEYLVEAWCYHAQVRGKKIRAFTSVDDFFAVINEFDLNTPIYIDSDLGEVRKGEDVAQQLYQMGFSNLYLATGYEARDYPVMPWIKAVVGKAPPF